MFSFIKTVFLKALTNPVKFSKTVTSKEDSALLTIINSVFHFIDLHKKDINIICNSKRVTTLQAVTWAGAARRIPRRRNSAGRQYARYCALGQGCKDPKPLRPVVE